MLEVTLFYLASAVALVATILAMTRANAIHALIYLIVSLLAVAVIFFIIGAPFAAALEIVIYAGAIMVLFVFVIMMLNLGEEGDARERQWLQPRIWSGPAALSLVLLGELLYLMSTITGPASIGVVSAKNRRHGALWPLRPGRRIGIDVTARRPGRVLPPRGAVPSSGRDRRCKNWQCRSTTCYWSHPCCFASACWD